MNLKTLKRISKYPLAFFCLYLICSVQVSAKPIKVGADIWPPFFMVDDGHHSGIAVDIIRR